MIANHFDDEGVPGWHVKGVDDSEHEIQHDELVERDEVKQSQQRKLGSPRFTRARVRLTPKVGAKVLG